MKTAPSLFSPARALKGRFFSSEVIKIELKSWT